MTPETTRFLELFDPQGAGFLAETSANLASAITTKVLIHANDEDRAEPLKEIFLQYGLTTPEELRTTESG